MAMSFGSLVGGDPASEMAVALHSAALRLSSAVHHQDPPIDVAAVLLRQGLATILWVGTRVVGTAGLVNRCLLICVICPE